MTQDKSILIVDDEPEIREWLNTVLEDGKDKILHAGSLSEALALFTLHKPYKVILDLILPDARGCEAVDGLKKAGAKNIVVLTGYPGQKSEALRLGATSYIEKPCSVFTLMRALDLPT
jgi:two-component system KDP operon response regulator KdpE